MVLSAKVGHLTNWLASTYFYNLHSLPSGAGITAPSRNFFLFLLPNLIQDGHVHMILHKLMTIQILQAKYQDFSNLDSAVLKFPWFISHVSGKEWDKEGHRLQSTVITAWTVGWGASPAVVGHSPSHIPSEKDSNSPAHLSAWPTSLALCSRLLLSYAVILRIKTLESVLKVDTYIRKLAPSMTILRIYRMETTQIAD